MAALKSVKGVERCPSRKMVKGPFSDLPLVKMRITSSASAETAIVLSSFLISSPGSSETRTVRVTPAGRACGFAGAGSEAAAAARSVNKTAMVPIFFTNIVPFLGV